MQRLGFLLIAAIAGLAWQESHAQLTPQEQQRALEVLRKKMAEDQQQPRTKPAQPAPAVKPAPAVQPAPTPMPRRAPASAAARSGTHDQMFELLHRALGQQERVAAPPRRPRRAPAAPVRAETPAPAAPKPAAPTVGKAATGVQKPAEPAAQQPAPTPAPPPVQAQKPAGPKTKVERLAELNALYFADEISPAEYHKRRAEILRDR